MQLTFYHYESFNPDEKERSLTLSYPIVVLDGFTLESTKAAQKIFLKYVEQNQADFEDINFIFQDHNIKLKVITKLPLELNEYLSPSEMKEASEIAE
ncbi:hypothetical protein [Lactobacillus crispatus]|uniref:hypothetical protein n=1 Tax=Lactobacillus crispatus TaxID=47770 RepID=UPI0001B29FB0|nr:hypothetical protein [Lactobacillus crispatus]EEU18466.1 hypothetical protein HMPREF5045_02018 [Lactobacillus crispatus 125-2-CHN]MBO4166344.1 hypothetical protein [Lactobacillus crispatus]MCZ9644665.1 hypothetical protein [Lactobacillus crispatus]